ncbi:hypothetical protein IP86_07500, partial [Rhodopseudomonas sp. AAP120]
PAGEKPSQVIEVEHAFTRHFNNFDLRWSKPPAAQHGCVLDRRNQKPLNRLGTNPESWRKRQRDRFGTS